MADTTAAESGRAYDKSEMVHVVDGSTGNVMEHPVPKSWIGTDLLPAGSKKATAKQVKSTDDVVSVDEAAEPDTGTVVVDTNPDADSAE
jgi:hypothetical protein